MDRRSLAEALIIFQVAKKTCGRHRIIICCPPPSFRPLIYGKEATFTFDARPFRSILSVEYLSPSLADAAADDRRFPRPGALFNEQSRDFENARFYLKRKRGPYFEAILLFKSKPRRRQYEMTGEKGAARRVKKRCRFFV